MLKEDLLDDFKTNKVFIDEQLKQLNLLANSLNKPVVARVWNSFILRLFEISCWILIIGVIVFCFVKDSYPPFYTLASLKYNNVLPYSTNVKDINALYYSVYIYAGIIVILLLLLARSINKIRKKNIILRTTVKSMKLVLGEFLKRKAEIEIIEQRNFVTPDNIEFKSANVRPTPTDVPNPGY